MLLRIYSQNDVNIAVFSQLSWCMGYIAGHARRFFHPAAIEEMLSSFVPLIDGTTLDVSY
jgi:hypothetical protein